MGTTIGAETCCWAEEIPDWLGRLGITCITLTSLLIDYRSVPQVTSSWHQLYLSKV